MAKNEVLYHFDFSENYQFIPQDELQSGHWNHQCCTLFTVLVHYKNANDCLQHESFVPVFDYMNHDKYAVLVFLEQISDRFKNLHPNITITRKYFRSDGAGQHFKQKYTICSMSLMKEEIEWDFSATSHGKGDIDGLGGTCKRRIREKTRACIIDPQTSLDFANCASEICPNINIIHCPTEIIENAKPTLDNSWMINRTTIPQLPGTRKVFHFFKRITDYVVAVQTITSDSSDYKEFPFLTEKFPSGEVLPAVDFQHVLFLKILKFEKSYNLIGREHFWANANA